MATALTLVFMLGLGALFLSFSVEVRADRSFSLLFGEVLGISNTELWPTIALSAVCLLVLAVLWRPLLLASVLPESARGHRPFRIEMAFLLLVALATTMTVPVVGTTLIFSLMIGPPAAARALTTRPASAMALSIALAVAIVWSCDRAVLPQRLADRLLRRVAQRRHLRCRANRSGAHSAPLSALPSRYKFSPVITAVTRIIAASHDRPVDVLAHHASAAGEQHQRHQRERDPEREHDL